MMIMIMLLINIQGVDLARGVGVWQVCVATVIAKIGVGVWQVLPA